MFDAIIKKRLPVDKMIITVVGDKALVKPGLSKSGYEVIEVDKEGDPITTAVNTGTVPAQMGSGAKKSD